MVLTEFKCAVAPGLWQKERNCRKCVFIQSGSVSCTNTESHTILIFFAHQGTPLELTSLNHFGTGSEAWQNIFPLIPYTDFSDQFRDFIQQLQVSAWFSLTQLFSMCYCSMGNMSLTESCTLCLAWNTASIKQGHFDIWTDVHYEMCYMMINQLISFAFLFNFLSFKCKGSCIYFPFYPFLHIAPSPVISFSPITLLSFLPFLPPHFLSSPGACTAQMVM